MDVAIPLQLVTSLLILHVLTEPLGEHSAKELGKFHVRWCQIQVRT